MPVIIAVVLFPLLLLLLTHKSRGTVAASRVEFFDTTAVPGYSDFKAFGVEMDEQSNLTLYEALYPLLGIAHRSRNRGVGLDCSGLVRKVYKKAYGIKLGGGSEDIYHQSVPIKKEELQEGDLVFFKIYSEQIDHLGIYLKEGKFIHTSSAMGVTINDLGERYYQDHYFGAGRLKKEEKD